MNSYESTDKMVSHPDHYMLIPEKNVQTKDIIKIVVKDIKGIQCTYLSNAIKYVLRCPFKGRYKQDIEKAIWYLQELLNEIEEEEKDSYD